MYNPIFSNDQHNAAARAVAALEARAQWAIRRPLITDPAEDVQALLGDLMHYCRREGLEFTPLLGAALEEYALTGLPEVSEDDDV